MKLTTKQLKRMIKEEYKLISEIEGDYNYDDPDEVLKIINDVDLESDLMYHETDNIKKMIVTLRREIADQQKEYNELNKQFNDAQRTHEGQMMYPPDWWDYYVFPIQRKINEMEDAIETLQRATDELVDMGLDPDPLTDHEIDYEFDGAIDFLNHVVVKKGVWVGKETAFRTTLLDEIEEYANYGDGWEIHPPEDKWRSIVHYVMDEYYKKIEKGR